MRSKRKGGMFVPRVKSVTSNKDYLANGVSIAPSTPSVGGSAKITYDGLLSKSGATHVIAHVGFGSQWNNVYDYKMSKTATGFEVTVPVATGDTLNVCFKDCADNWDNNTGKNYSFDITD